LFKKGVLDIKLTLLPWLKNELERNDFEVHVPEMPRPYEPDYDEWLDVFSQYSIDENTTLIGHSGGGGFLVRWLSENDVKVGKVILVAPWIDVEGILKNDFFHFQIDQNIPNKTKGLIIFGSDNDEDDIKLSIQKLREEIPNILYREFHYGHFTSNDMGKNDFPELLEKIIE